jgi:hypothetical protein
MASMSFPYDGGSVEDVPEASPPDPADIALEDETLYAGPKETPRQTMPDATDALERALANAPQTASGTSSRSLGAAGLSGMAPPESVQATPAATPETVPAANGHDLGGVALRPAPERVESSPREAESEAEPEPATPLGARFVRSVPPLGRRAVEAAERAGESEDPTKTRQEVSDTLADVREKMANLKKAQGDDADDRCSLIFHAEHWPNELKSLVQANAPEEEKLIDKLIAKDDAGQPRFDDSSLLNLLQWHGHHHKEVEKEFLEEHLPKHLAAVSSFVEEGVEEEWLPPVAPQRLLAVRTHTGIYLDDGMRTIVNWSGGLYKDEEDAIYLGYPDQEPVFQHENQHAMARQRNKWGLVIEGDSSLKHILPGLGTSLLVESTTAQLTCRAMEPGKSIYDVWPSERDDTSYPDERWFLDALCRYGKHPVDVRRFIDAMYEGPEERISRGPNSAHHNLRRAIKRAFPNDMKLRDLMVGMHSQTYRSSGRLTAATAQLRKRNKRPARYAYEPDFHFA